MTPEQQVALLRKQRSSWVDLEDGKSVLVQRPGEMQWREFMSFSEEGKVTGFSADLHHVQRYVTDWKGFTEADVLGGAGGSDQLAFHPEVWAEVVLDQAAWYTKVAEKLCEMVTSHLAASAEKAKN